VTRRDEILRAPRRAGATLVELLIACALLGIFGAAAMRLLSSQVRFVDAEHEMRAARSVSRQSYALLVAELRAVDATRGVVASAPGSVTLRVPHAFGTVCDTQGGATIVSLVSTDAYGGAVTQGYAWRGATGAYDYDETVPLRTIAPVDSGPCVARGIATPPGAHVVSVTPALDPAVPVAATVFLFERVRYAFAPSAAVPGRRGLWRTGLGSQRSEEVAAPFDTSAAFRFFASAADTSRATLAPDSVRGLDLVLVGASERPRWGRAAPELAPFRAAIYFGSAQ
jgi:type II secretory pathway pseudopilin PulG